MRVLIAGCGYVGCALAEMLRDAGHAVSGLRRSPEKLPTGIVPLGADLGDPASVQATLGGQHFDAVVYAAAADARDEASYRRAYVEGLSHLLDVLPVPERLLFTSSTAVYGQNDGQLVDESSATEPTRFTGNIMLEAEELVDHHACTSVAVRFGGIYGPTRTRLVDRVRDGLAQLPAGPKFTNRIHRDDCAGVLAHLLELDDPPPIVVGVDDDAADMGDVLTWLAERLGVPRPPRSTDEPAAPGKRCSNRRLRDTGYTFRYPSFRDGYLAMTASGASGAAPE